MRVAALKFLADQAVADHVHRHNVPVGSEGRQAELGHFESSPSTRPCRRSPMIGSTRSSVKRATVCHAFLAQQRADIIQIDGFNGVRPCGLRENLEYIRVAYSAGPSQKSAESSAPESLSIYHAVNISGRIREPDHVHSRPTCARSTIWGCASCRCWAVVGCSATQNAEGRCIDL